jgi:hypothetical protein
MQPMKVILICFFALCAFTTFVTIKAMQPQSLAEFKWQHRLLITQVDSEMERIKL